MRNLRKKMLRLQRFKNRMALAILLLSATPSMAGPPTSSSFFASSADAAANQSWPRQVQTNPFCDPESLQVPETVQLASGGDQSTLRLKPVGKAIGLRTLNETGSGPMETTDPNESKITIEAVPSIVRTNPLIGSVHHGDRDLVNAKIMDAVPEPQAVAVRRESMVVLKPTVRTRKAIAPEATNNLTLEPPTQTIDSPHAQPESAAVVPQIVPRREAEPIHFSLTDQSASQSRSEQQAETNSGAASADSSAAVQMESISDSQLSNSEMTAESASIQLSEAPTTNVQTPPTSRRPNVPTITHNQVQQPTDPSHKRYRPPVAVKSVPLEIERVASNGAEDSPVHAAPNFEPNVVALANGIDRDLPTLHLCLAQVRCLTIGGTLQSAQLADTSICKIVESGSNQLKLIGTSEGVTTLIVIAESESADHKSMRRAFEIHVSEAPQSRGDSLVETCALLNRSIRETFPACEVIVLEQGNELMVAGRCDSQESAKKILRMVRKTCLVPVKDELVVH